MIFEPLKTKTSFVFIGMISNKKAVLKIFFRYNLKYTSPSKHRGGLPIRPKDSADPSTEFKKTGENYSKSAGIMKIEKPGHKRMLFHIGSHSWFFMIREDPESQGKSCVKV